MSTSLLISNMRQAADQRGLSVEVTSVLVAEAVHVFKNYDVILLGPQVRHHISQFENAGIPVEIINMRDYGTMNGWRVLKQVLSAI